MYRPAENKICIQEGAKRADTRWEDTVTPSVSICSSIIFIPRIRANGVTYPNSQAMAGGFRTQGTLRRCF
jgi:hypothetical protein